MRLSVLLVVVVACSHDTARSRDKLVQEIGDYAAQLHRGGPRQPGDLEDVRPPSEAELRWITDPSDHDPLERQLLGIRLVQQCAQIGDAYVAQHDPKAIGWLLARIDVFAEMADVSAHELKLGSDEQLSSLATDDLGQLVHMTLETAEDDLRNLRKLPVDVYLQIVRGWRARVGKLRAMWTQGECDKVAGMIAIKILGENDHAVKQALEDLAAQLHDCKGDGR